MRTLGERISYLRNQRGFSQGDFAKMLKIAKSTLGMYETDKREPSNDTLTKIADYFDVTLDWLITGSDKTMNSIEEPKEDPVDKLIEYLDRGLSIEQIKELLDFKVGDLTLTDEEQDEFLAFVITKRAMKKKPSAASRFEVQ